MYTRFFFFANSGFLAGFDLCLKDKHVEETNIIFSFTSFWQCGKRNRALSAFLVASSAMHEARGERSIEFLLQMQTDLFGPNA